MIKGRKCDGSVKDCCTELSQCDAGEGYCNSDDQCKENLICGKRNCIGSNFNWPRGNCCTEPEVDPGCDTIC